MRAIIKKTKNIYDKVRQIFKFIFLLLDDEGEGE
jgi:hypothetical protein